MVNICTARLENPGWILGDSDDINLYYVCSLFSLTQGRKSLVKCENVEITGYVFKILIR
jgi:hypothetical protein